MLNDGTPKIPEPSRWALAMFRGRLQPCRDYDDWLELRTYGKAAALIAWTREGLGIEGLWNLQREIETAEDCRKAVGNVADVADERRREMTMALCRDIARAAVVALELVARKKVEAAILNVVTCALDIDPPDFIDMETEALPDTEGIEPGTVGLLRAVLYSTIGEMYKAKAETLIGTGDAQGAAYAAFTAGTAFEATHAALAFRAAIARYHQDEGRKAETSRERVPLGKCIYDRIVGLRGNGTPNAKSLAFVACLKKEPGYEKVRHPLTEGQRKKMQRALQEFLKQSGLTDPTRTKR
jgi:hypothetical protein